MLPIGLRDIRFNSVAHIDDSRIVHHTSHLREQNRDFLFPFVTAFHPNSLFRRNFLILRDPHCPTLGPADALFMKHAGWRKSYRHGSSVSSREKRALLSKTPRTNLESVSGREFNESSFPRSNVVIFHVIRLAYFILQHHYRSANDYSIWKHVTTMICNIILNRWNARREARDLKLMLCASCTRQSTVNSVYSRTTKDSERVVSYAAAVLPLLMINHTRYKYGTYLCINTIIL